VPAPQTNSVYISNSSQLFPDMGPLFQVRVFLLQTKASEDEAHLRPNKIKEENESK